MKKLFVGLVSMLLMLCITGCSGESEEPTSTESETESTPTQLDSYIGGELTDLMAAVEELGYEATYFNQLVDWTEILPMVDTWSQEFLDGELDVDPDAKTVSVDLKLKVNAEQEEMEGALEEKLNTVSAWKAVEKYGRIFYGTDDFEVDYLVGQISAFAEDENTWSLKATGKLYGSDVTCEAMVTGTSENPEVLSLNVY